MNQLIKQFILNTRKEVGMLEKPQFLKAAGHNDWRRYVPLEIVAIWDDLTYEAKCVAYFFAKTQLNLKEQD